MARERTGMPAIVAGAAPRVSRAATATTWPPAAVMASAAAETAEPALIASSTIATRRSVTSPSQGAALGPGEVGVNGVGDGQGQVGTAGQRSADEVAGRQQVGERRHVRAQAARMGEQGVQVEPQVAVIAGRVREVAAVGRDEV